MQNSFLGNTAQKIMDTHGTDLRSICIVLPNSRAAQFLYKELAIRNNNKPIWAPQIKTSVQLLREHSNLLSADRLILLNELFQIHKQITSRNEPFYRFFPWGEILLNDFNDIDVYRVPAKVLYTNLSAEKEISLDFSYLTEEQLDAIRRFWGQFAANQQEAEKAFTEIWKNLFPIYDSFRNKLQSLGIGYDGMILRDAAENLQKRWTKGRFKEYIMVGFNQLDACERELFETIMTQENHSFHWDYDAHYVENPKHEAGLFARKNAKFHSLENMPQSLAHKNLPLRIMACSSDAAQAQWIGKIMQNEDMNPNNTAIILPREEILPSLLSAIPPHYPKVNVTMGYPIYFSALYPLADALFQLKKRSKPGKENTWLYMPLLKKVLHNPYIQHILTAEQLRLLQEWKQKIYIKLQEAKDSFPILADSVFSSVDLKSFYRDFLGLLESIQQNEESTLPQIDRQIIPVVHKELRRMHELMDPAHLDENPEDQIKIIQSLLKSLKVPFLGEPVEGLQIMGPLESRSLDFDYVIIPHMNEGSMPGDGSSNSYIPQSLRKAFGMPGPDEKLAAQSYFFYRLLHKAKHVFLLYNSEADGLSTGEKSRFIWQLQHELKSFRFEETRLNTIFISGNMPPIQIEKTPDIMEELMKYTTQVQNPKSISPTALSSYMGCSLRFYFSKIARLKEEDVLEEDIDSRKFGNILHQTLELLYLPYLNKHIQKNDLLNMLSKLNAVLDEAFMESVNQNSELEIEAENIIIKELIRDYALKVLHNDMERVPFTLLATELGKERSKALFFHLPLTDSDFKIRFSGIVDRIDRKDDWVEIIDYKTGSVTLNCSSADKIFLENESDALKAILQTFLYEEMYKETLDPAAKTKAKIYALKKNENLLEATTVRKKEPDESFRQEMMENLQERVGQLFNPNIPFSQTKHIKNCAYCEFKGICNR